MIHVTFYQNILIVQGHANYAPKGKDIVCAAVSTLVNALTGTLEVAGNLYKAILTPGFAYVESRKDDPAFDVVRCGLWQLAKKYPEHVSVDKAEDGETDHGSAAAPQ